MWACLTGITTPDDRTLILTLKDPLYQDFASNLYSLPIVPEHLWRDRSEQEITTGAYRYLSPAQDCNVWQRNDQWWGIGVFGRPAPKYLVDIRTTGNNVALRMRRYFALSCLVMTFILQFGEAILIAATLDFIGLRPTSAQSLGLMMQTAVLWGALPLGGWWWFMPPGLAITAIVGALYVMNVGLDDVFNPRLRGR